MPSPARRLGHLTRRRVDDDDAPCVGTYSRSPATARLPDVEPSGSDSESTICAVSGSIFARKVEPWVNDQTKPSANAIWPMRVSSSDLLSVSTVGTGNSSAGSPPSARRSRVATSTR
jgi:hypothetical protein